ncbi:MAG: hypothetical protein P1U85_22585, partial [Verrucomicrobiales bacterium]|nr:hypothetical protein [Verrucomicrobiales bacterium]
VQVEFRVFPNFFLRMGLAVSSDESAPAVAHINFDGSNNFPEWHSVFEFKNTKIELDASIVSEVVLVGGIRTNQPVHVSSGTLRIKQQFDPKGLETILSRNAWIEAYRL